MLLSNSKQHHACKEAEVPNLENAAGRPATKTAPRRTTLVLGGTGRTGALVARKLAERGLNVDYRSVWNFVHAEKLSFKKRH